MKRKRTPPTDLVWITAMLLVVLIANKAGLPLPPLLVGVRVEVERRGRQ